MRRGHVPRGAGEGEEGLIDKWIRRIAEKAGKNPDEEAKAVLGRIAFGEQVGAFEGCDLVVEAIVEDFAAKADAFRKIDAVAPAGAVLASNTSSISITRIAACTKRPEKVVGMHFMNPVPVMKLVLHRDQFRLPLARPRCVERCRAGQAHLCGQSRQPLTASR